MPSRAECFHSLFAKLIFAGLERAGLPFNRGSWLRAERSLLTKPDAAGMMRTVTGLDSVAPLVPAGQYGAIFR